MASAFKLTGGNFLISSETDGEIRIKKTTVIDITNTGAANENFGASFMSVPLSRDLKIKRIRMKPAFIFLINNGTDYLMVDPLPLLNLQIFEAYLGYSSIDENVFRNGAAAGYADLELYNAQIQNKMCLLAGEHSPDMSLETNYTMKLSQGFLSTFIKVTLPSTDIDDYSSMLLSYWKIRDTNVVSALFSGIRIFTDIYSIKA